jgi:hypothetical protein
MLKSVTPEQILIVHEMSSVPDISATRKVGLSESF